MCKNLKKIADLLTYYDDKYCLFNKQKHEFVNIHNTCDTEWVELFLRLNELRNPSLVEFSERTIKYKI